MNYEEKFKKYLSGELEESEEREVKQDIEKLKVLMAYSDETLDEELFEASDPERTDGFSDLDEKSESRKKDTDELSKKVSRAVSRKFKRYAMAAAAIAVVIVLLIIVGLSPLLDRIYYNPGKTMEVKREEGGETYTYIYGTFDLVMTTYMELACADKGWSHAAVKPEGYGRYSIDVRTQINGEDTHYPMDLVRNHLYATDFGWNSSDMPYNAFTYLNGEGYSGDYCGISKERAGEILKDLPETTHIRAAVSFSDIKQADELNEFMKKYKVQFLSFPFRTDDIDSYLQFSPKVAGYDWKGSYDEKKYPYLDLTEKKQKDRTGETYIKHVESMLKYMIDNEEFLEIFDSILWDGNLANIEKYESALNYVQEHGLNCFGTVVYGDKEGLMEMLEDPTVEGIYMMDSKLELN